MGFEQTYTLEHCGLISPIDVDGSLWDPVFGDDGHGGPLTEDQRVQIEEVTNEAVEADYAVHTFNTALHKAKEMGAMALFGENYPDEVRVVEIGGPFSLELCGGTHVGSSAQIGPVTILGESSVGSGVRRVEAYVGLDSFRHLAKERALMAGLASSLKVPSEEVPARVATLVEKLRAAEKELDRLRLANARAAAANAAAGAEQIGKVRLVAQRMAGGMSANDLRSLVGDIRGKLGSDPGVVALLSEGDDDTVPFVDLLHNVNPGESLDLLLHTGGGDIDAAEKLISMIRTKVGDATLRVIVPDYAKSAGTLMVLGADMVVMSDTSELGPIDPQIIRGDGNGNRIRHSVQSYLDAYDEHSATLAREPGNVAAQIMLGKLDPATWPVLDDEALIDALVDVKGIGRWTAEMFLMFHEMRANVLPVDDIGLQKACALHYFDGARPTLAELRALGENWQPYRSVATWYLWRALDPIPVEY